MNIRVWVSTLNEVYQSKVVSVDKDRIIKSKINSLIILRRDLEKAVYPSILDITEDELQDIYEAM